MKEAGAQPLFVSTTVGLDEFNYAIHAIETICSFITSSPTSCRFMGESKVSEGCVAENYYIKFESGASAVCTSLKGKFVYFNTTVVTDNESVGDFCFTIDNSKFYKAMLDEVCNELEGLENNLIPVSKMVEAIKILLAGTASKLTGGIEVSLDSPLLEVTSFDGNEFEKGYAAAARKAAEAAKKAAKK